MTGNQCAPATQPSPARIAPRSTSTISASFPASPTANVCQKAGYTNARVKATVRSGADIVTDSAHADGIRAAGMQFDLGSNAYVDGGYRYSNYDAGFERPQAVLTLGFRM